MVDLAIITPTRGRPEQFAELVDAVQRTTDGRATVVGLVDNDDPQRAAYDALGCTTWTGPRKSLSAWTNCAASILLEGPDAPRYLASLGDDHRPRTSGFDQKLIGAIEERGEPGIAYGNDLLQGAKLPTAWVMSAEIVRALGWMMLPTCEHMYVDSAILALGQASGRIVYRPDVVIEHLHPAAGKADWDQSYRDSNAADRFAKDSEAFTRWQREGGLAADVEKLDAAQLSTVGGD